MKSFIFPKDEKKPTSNEQFFIGNRINSGGQAIIKEASKDKKDFSKYIGKKLFKNFGIPLTDEFITMYNIKSKFIGKVFKIQTIKSGDNTKTEYLIMKRYKRSLQDFISEKRTDIDSEVYHFEILLKITTLLAGVLHLHVQKNPIMHHDLSPNNIMLETVNGTDAISVIIDFGLIKTNISQTISTGKKRYKPDGTYTERSELMSVAMILLELIYHSPLIYIENLFVTATFCSTSFKFKTNYNPEKLEIVAYNIKEAFKVRKDCIFQIMNVLTSEEKLKSLIGDDYISEKLLKRYFDVISDLDIIMQYNQDFTEIAENVYGYMCNYKSFLYSMFHQKNYLYDRDDFFRYQQKIVEIYNTNLDNYTEESAEQFEDLMKNVSKFHTDINFFRLNCLFGKFYKFLKDNKFNEDDDQISVNSKLFQLLLSLDFNTTRSMKYFVDSLNSIIFGANQETIKNIKAFYGVDARAKFNYLFTKSSKHDKEKFDVILHDCNVNLFKGLASAQNSDSNIFTFIMNELKIHDEFKENLKEDFKDLTFSEFVKDFNDEESAGMADHYKYMSYYDNGVRENFLNTLRDRFGEDFIFICILMFIHKYQELVFGEDESTFLQISEMFDNYETDKSHYELDMKVIYEHYAFIETALCEETLLKCQKILPEYLRKLEPDDFIKVVNVIANKKEKKHNNNNDDDDDNNENDNNKFNEYENLINSLNDDDPINSIIKINQFLYEILARNVDRKKICQNFFDSNFTEEDADFPSFDGVRFDMIKLDENISFELFRTNKDKVKFKFLCTYYEPFNYNESIYTLREKSRTLTDFLKNATAEQRTKIAIHLSYDFAFLLSLPYSISFDINEKYIVIDDSGLPKLQIIPVNDSSYFTLLSKFGNVLDLIQGESEQKNEYLDSTISIIKQQEKREIDPLFPLFPDIFFDFFNEPICYYFPGVENYEEFVNPLKEMFRYDLKTDTFRCIANQLFGFDYLFNIDYLLLNVNDEFDLLNHDFVKRINSIVTKKAKTNNFLKNNEVLKEIIKFFDKFFTCDPHNIVHSLYQMYHYNAKSYRKFTGKKPPKDLLLIDCKNMNEDAKLKLYQITYKFIVPMKYQIGDTSKLAFQVPSKKFSFENEEILFKDSKNLYNFIFSLIGALTYLVKMSNEDYLIPNSSKDIDIYINDNSEALLLPYSMKFEDAKQLLIKVFNKLIPKEEKAIKFLKESSTNSLTDLYFDLNSHIYPYQCADYIPFNYKDSIELRNLFGLNYLSALNQHFHFKFPTTDKDEFKRIFNPFINKGNYPRFSDLINFSKKTNCLSPLCMQLLEQSLEEEGEIGKTARLYLDALKSYKKIKIDRIKRGEKIYDKGSTIYKGIYIDDDGKEKKIALKAANEHTRRYLHQIVMMFWRMSVIFKDEESKKYFVNEYGFCGFDIIMDYYENGDLAAKFSLFKTGQEKLDLILEIAKGLFYLHREKIIHRDMKPDNIFIDDGNKPRIGDLITMHPEENDKDLQEMEMTNAATHFYYNEDLTLTDRDVYAFGIICVEILKGKKFTFTNNSKWLNSNDTIEKNKYLISELNKITIEANDDCTVHVINFLKDNIFSDGDMPVVSEFYLIKFRVTGDDSSLPEDVKKSPIYSSFGSLNSNWNKSNFEEKIAYTQKTFDEITLIKKDEDKYKANKYDIIIINIFMAQKVKELLMIDDKNEQVNQFKIFLINSYDDYFNSYNKLDTNKTLDDINEKAIVKKINDIVYSRVLLNKFIGLEKKEDIIMKMKRCLLNRTVDISKKLNVIYKSENEAISDLNERRDVSYLSEIKFVIDLLEERNDIDVGFFYHVVLPDGRPEKEIVKNDLQLRLNSIEFLYDCLENKYPDNDKYEDDLEYEYNDFQNYITSLFDDLKDSPLYDEFTGFLIGDSFKENSRIDRCSFIALFFCIFLDNLNRYKYLSPLFDDVIKYVVDNYLNKEDASVNVKNQFYKRMIAVVRDINEFGEKRKLFYDKLFNSSEE